MGSWPAGRFADRADVAALLKDLRSVVGRNNLLVDPDLRAGFEVDWTGRYRGEALAVARPGSVDEVAVVLALCNEAGIGVVPQGGNTGLVGGGVPRSGEVVVSLRRLSKIFEVDAIGGAVTTEAGVTLAELHQVAAAAGYDFAVDLGARDAATVGGMVATNAGGFRVMRHGTMRSQLLGIEAVMADGSIVRRLTGVHKDNTGYDLASLLAGSEGTLGVITKARLQLVPRMDRRAVALLAVAGTDSAVQIVADARRADTPLVAAEIFFEDGLQLVLSHAKAEPPFARAYPAYLLLEAASDRDPVAELSKLLTSRSDVLDVVVSEDSVGRSRLWRLRDGLSEAINGQGVPHKLDVAVPTASLGAFEQKLRELVRNLSPAARTIIWGHVGDGNLHINILGLTAADQRVDDAVLRLTIEMAGSTSGEHGVGIAKANWLAIDRSAGDMAAMRAIKQALDPRGIMNPGVLFGAIPAIRAG